MDNLNEREVKNIYSENFAVADVRYSNEKIIQHVNLNQITCRVKNLNILSYNGLKEQKSHSGKKDN